MFHPRPGSRTYSMVESVGSDASVFCALNASRAAWRAKCLTRRDSASDGRGLLTAGRRELVGDEALMVGRWWAVSRIARSNYADFSLRQQLSPTHWSRFAPADRKPHRMSS